MNRNSARVFAVLWTSIGIVLASLWPPWFRASAHRGKLEWRFLFDPPWESSMETTIEVALSVYLAELLAIGAVGAAIWILAGLKAGK